MVASVLLGTVLVLGVALGGGCELAVHCAHRVAHFESYIGLVEVGVGLDWEAMRCCLYLPTAVR
ncbi:3-hydroxyacyl-CoA dehydrogenase [Alcaligenes faecalis subsp. faecalis NCIB 8687]|nr:3-hydroxyacyl-CoA dehydrogenase [Alcaligenes faecalis subsp. faecalis NCIB 8687]